MYVSLGCAHPTARFCTRAPVIASSSSVTRSEENYRLSEQGELNSLVRPLPGRCSIAHLQHLIVSTVERMRGSAKDSADPCVFPRRAGVAEPGIQC
jgi:hypothetical protein